MDALHAERDYSPDGFDRVILLGNNGLERAVLPRILSIRDPYPATRSGPPSSCRT